MSGWPELRDSRTVQAGHAPGTVIRCGVRDTMLANLPVSAVFFFDATLDVENMAAGLSRALAHVPAFAGRFRAHDGFLEIVCDDAGVPMETYDIDETLAEAIGRVTMPNSGMVNQIDGAKTRAGDGPMLTVRISRLAGGGTALGCSWHHALGDMATFMALIKAWSAATEGTPLPDVPATPDRDAFLYGLIPPESSGVPTVRLVGADEAAALAREIEVSMRANRTVQIYYTDDEVGRMREQFGAKAGRILSANDVICAHTVTVIRDLDDYQGERSLTIPINIRRRLDLPPNMLGNLLTEITVRYPPADTEEQFAAGIRAAVEEFTAGPMSLRDDLALVESVGWDRIAECVPLGFDPAHRAFTFSNWTRFDAAGLALDGHRPVLFSPAGGVQLPWVAWMTEGFGGADYLVTVVVPVRMAGQLRGADGRAEVHRYRDPGDVLPSLVESARRLI